MAFLIDEAHRSQEGSMARIIRTPFRDPQLRREVREKLAMVAEEKHSIWQVNLRSQTSTIQRLRGFRHDAEAPDAEDAQEQADPQDQIAKEDPRA